MLLPILKVSLRQRIGVIIHRKPERRAAANQILSLSTLANQILLKLLNGSRLSGGALKNDSFRNLRAPPASALVRLHGEPGAACGQSSNMVLNLRLPTACKLVT